MKRRIVMILLILFSFILQSTVFSYLSIASVKPNLLLILTVSFALIRGKREGMFVGFSSGFLCDLFFGNIIGFNALVYTCIGFMIGKCYRLFYDDDIKMPVLLVIASDFSYSVLMYGAQFLLRGRIEFFYYLKRIIIPEMIYTAIITIVFYRLLLGINRRLQKTEQRSVGSIV